MILSENAPSSSSGQSESDSENTGNPAMADAMRKVLQMGKNMGKTTVVLAKAKLLTDAPKEKATKPKDPGFEVAKAPDGSHAELVVEEALTVDDVKPDSKSLAKLRKLRKIEWATKGRLKPSPLDREKERPLMKMATRGVVQLFNAVREQQKFITKKIEEEGRTETKKDKVLKSINKKTFLDVLRGQENTRKRSSPEPEEIKSEEEGSEKGDQPNWSVLREDFMMGAKLKDWDKGAAEERQEVKRPRVKTSQ